MLFFVSALRRGRKGAYLPKEEGSEREGMKSYARGDRSVAPATRYRLNNAVVFESGQIALGQTQQGTENFFIVLTQQRSRMHFGWRV